MLVVNFGMHGVQCTACILLVLYIMGSLCGLKLRAGFLKVGVFRLYTQHNGNLPSDPMVAWLGISKAPHFQDLISFEYPLAELYKSWSCFRVM